MGGSTQRLQTVLAATSSAPIAHGALVPFEERFLAQQEQARARPVDGRPRYVGCTESAEVREATCRSLLRTWPGGPVDEFWTVVGGLSGLDALAALAMAQIPVHKVVLFDRDPLQLLFGELMLFLVDLCPSRELLLKVLFGRSVASWGRCLSVSTMLDFVELPVDGAVEAEVLAQLPPRLREVYGAVFACLARRAGWPPVWPCFGRQQRLPARRLPNAKRRLGGGRNEALHVGEVGWLRDEQSYGRLRAAALPELCAFRRFDLAEPPALEPARRVFFISNVDGSPQFMDSTGLDNLRAMLRGADDSGGTLLLSTLRAEWLGPEG